MDPEFKKELEEARKGRGSGGAAAVANPAANFDLAGYLSGASSNSATTSGAKQQQGKGNKRK